MRVRLTDLPLLLCAMMLCGFSARAQPSPLAPLPENTIDRKLADARVALNQLHEKLPQEQVARLESRFSAIQDSWREVKRLSLAAGRAPPEEYPDFKRQPHAIANPAVVAAPVAAAELLVPLIALGGLVYVIHQYRSAPGLEHRERLSFVLVELAGKFQAFADEAKAIRDGLKVLPKADIETAGKRKCFCTCVGEPQPRTSPDRRHAEPVVGPVSHEAECRSECVYRAFPSYRCN